MEDVQIQGAGPVLTGACGREYVEDQAGFHIPEEVIANIAQQNS